MTAILAFLLAQAGVQSPGAPVVADAGPRLFAASCASGYCHGADGAAANRGPRLRGRNFERSYVERVVRKGIPNTAMPGFEDRLKAEELSAVIEFVMRISAGSTGESPTATPAAAGQPAAAPGSVPQRLSPGEALFFEATREVRCSTCHEWRGKGIAVAAIPAGASLPMRPRKVQRVTLKTAETFPGLIAFEDPEILRVYDLTVPPPVLRSLRKEEIASVAPEPNWVHADVTREYSPGEMREILQELK